MKKKLLLCATAVLLACTVLFAACTDNTDTTYTVTFDVNGGSGSSFTREVTVGDAIGEIDAEPTRSGFTFVGWSPVKDGLNTVGADFKPTGDVTLYAAWVAEGTDIFTVTFDLNGGTGENFTKKYADGTALGTVGIPTKTGYVFLGWSAVKDDLDTIVAATESVTESATLYALWAEETPENIVRAAYQKTLGEMTGYTFKFGDEEDPMEYRVNFLSGIPMTAYGTGEGMEMWILDGYFYEYGDSAATKQTNPADMLDRIVYLPDSYVNQVLEYGEDFAAGENGSYTISLDGTVTVYISDGRVTKAEMEDEFALEYVYTAGGVTLPALPSVEWDNLYVLTVVLMADGEEIDREQMTDETNDVWEMLDNAGTPSGYEAEGAYTDKACTIAIADSLVLTADTTVYVKVYRVVTENEFTNALEAAGFDVEEIYLSETMFLAASIDDNNQLVFRLFETEALAIEAEPILLATAEDADLTYRRIGRMVYAGNGEPLAVLERLIAQR